MTEFDPGPGWREITRDEWLRAPVEQRGFDWFSNVERRYWIREEPVPPLPTTPYTVIRVTWRDSTEDADSVLHLVVDENGDPRWSGLHPLTLPERITGFEVLAEPRRAETVADVLADRERVRRETAEAFWKRLHELRPGDDEIHWAAQILSEFGVDQ